MLHQTWQDIRFGLALWYRDWRLALIMVMVIGMAIGPNVFFFSVVNQVLFRPLDIEGYDRFISLGSSRDGNAPDEPQTLTYPTVESLGQQESNLEYVVGMTVSKVVFQLGDTKARANCHVVSSSFFDACGRSAVLGDVFHHQTTEYPGSQPYVVLSDRGYQKFFGRDPDVLGKEVVINGFPFKVIGVMGPKFTGITSVMVPDMWVPMMMIGQIRPDDSGRLRDHGHQWCLTVAKRRAGVSDEQINASLLSVCESLAAAHPEEYQDLKLGFFAFDHMAGFLPKMVPMVLTGLFSVFGAILLVACSSVAALLLSRATARRQEIAMRMAVGATRGRVVRQLITESLLVSCVAGLFGVVLALWSLVVFARLFPELPFTLSPEVTFDAGVVSFTLICVIGCGFLFGLTPALNCTKGALMPALKDQPGGLGAAYRVSKLRSAFLVGQFTLSSGLLILAFMGMRGLMRLQGEDPGYEVDHLLTYKVDPAQIGMSRDEVGRFQDKVKTALMQVPGVTGVAVSRVGVFGSHRTNTRVRIVDEQLGEAEPIRTSYNNVNPSFFEVAALPLLKGRAFNEGDDPSVMPTVIVNEAFAKKYFRDGDAVGKFMMVHHSEEASRVVGVVKNAKYYRLDEKDKPIVYLPLPPRFSFEATFLVHTEPPASTVLSHARVALGAVHDSLLPEEMLVVRTVMMQTLTIPRLVAYSLFGLGFLAFLLAMTGAYGVVAYSVDLRRQEVGIRLALGALPASVVRLLMRQGMLLILAGLALGAGLGFLIVKQLQPVLTGASVLDPLAYLVPVFFLLTIGALALFFPARRLVSCEPAISLRWE